ncbi:hypothetical protein E2C01_069234 [Portunus trituberculatus]|uniref:Uncharacterized protein n=1 Tax=Portunus trituberculatus TaxID=210409 RepID=A0A5B7HYU7_PORTR|nr:hypothetical protein [Portunus trituberculatus]
MGRPSPVQHTAHTFPRLPCKIISPLLCTEKHSSERGSPSL